MSMVVGIAVLSSDKALFRRQRHILGLRQLRRINHPIIVPGNRTIVATPHKVRLMAVDDLKCHLVLVVCDHDMARRISYLTSFLHILRVLERHKYNRIPKVTYTRSVLKHYMDVAR